MQVAAPQSELLGGQASELVKRVEELRVLYRAHREQLGDGYSVLRSRGVFGNVARKDDEAGHAPSTRSQDDSSSDESERRAKRAAVAAAMRAKYFMDNVDSTQLQTVVRQTLAEHGGSAHLDTVVEYVRMRWPNLRRRDATHYTVSDFRKLTLNCLRQHRRTLFVPDWYHENCFSLLAQPSGDAPADAPPSPNDDAQELEDESHDVRDTLANVLVRQLEARGAVWPSGTGAVPQASHAAGVLHDELIAAAAQALKATSPLESDELREALHITLATNPRFRRDPRRPDAVLAAPRRSRNAQEHAGSGYNNGTANGAAAGGGGGAREREREREREAASGRGEWKRRRGGGKGGAVDDADEDEEAHNDHDDDDDMPSRPRSAVRRGVRGAGAAQTTGKGALGKRGRDSGREKEKEEKNPWIQCDGCHRWVQARSDNIEDISLYDDANPDHLDYFCPRCRKKRGTEPADDASDSKRNNSSKKRQQQSEAGEEASTRRSTRGKGSGRKRGADEGDEDEDEGEDEGGAGKLESVERALLDEWEDEKAQRAASLDGDSERLAAVRSVERKFEEEAAKYKATLVGHRNAAWERNAREADAGDVELLDDKAEEELAIQFKEWFEKRRAKLRQHIESTLHD